jgi:DNA-binding MarR family transcriptional regulator
LAEASESGNLTVMSPAPPLRLSPAECTCFRIRGAARRVTQIYSRHLAPTGLKISQFSLLGFVAAEGPISIGRLSDLLATDRTTLTRNLHPLLQGGLVERATSGDKRRHDLVATPDGRALFKRALPLWVAAEQEVRAAMGARLTADLHGALDRSMEKLAAL